MAGKFLGYLMQPYSFVTEFKWHSIEIFASKGQSVMMGSRAVQNSHSLWAQKCRAWGNDLQPKNGGPPATGQVDPSFKLSHIKYAGALLWAINKVQPIVDCAPLTADQRSLYEGKGVVCGDAGVSLITSFPNEIAAVSFVFQQFNRVQFARGLPTRVDFANPPLTTHYLRNLCLLLRRDNPSAEALYLIFKTMDLYGIEHKAS